MQNHALHNIRILHQAYVFFSSEIEMQSFAFDKSLRKTFGGKKIIQIDQSFKKISLNSLKIQPTDNQV